MLSLAVAHCLASAHVVLVDRDEGPNRSKTDKMIKLCGGNVTRLTIDIRHLVLSRAGLPRQRPVVGLSRSLSVSLACVFAILAYVLCLDVLVLRAHVETSRVDGKYNVCA